MLKIIINPIVPFSLVFVIIVQQTYLGEDIHKDNLRNNNYTCTRFCTL